MVELLRLLRCDVKREVSATERVGSAELNRLMASRVRGEESVDFDRHRAVDVDRNRRDRRVPGLEQANRVEDILRALDGKSGDHDRPTPLQAGGNRPHQVAERVGGMMTIPVGPFADDDVGGIQWCGIVEQAASVPADVPRKDDALPFDLGVNVGGAENVPRVMVLVYRAGDVEVVLQVDRSHELQGRRHIARVVKRSARGRSRAAAGAVGASPRPRGRSP